MQDESCSSRYFLLFFEFWLIYNIILVSVVKHSDIFIDYSFNNFITHVKTSFKAIAK